MTASRSDCWTGTTATLTPDRKPALLFDQHNFRLFWGRTPRVPANRVSARCWGAVAAEILHCVATGTAPIQSHWKVRLCRALDVSKADMPSPASGAFSFPAIKGYSPFFLSSNISLSVKLTSMSGSQNALVLSIERWYGGSVLTSGPQYMPVNI